jgi:hypothetical protein
MYQPIDKVEQLLPGALILGISACLQLVYQGLVGCFRRARARAKEAVDPLLVKGVDFAL